MGLLDNWNKDKFNVYKREEKTVLKLLQVISDWMDKIINLTDDINKLANSNFLNKVSHTEMTNNYKLDNTGNFTGTWNGLEMHQTDEGLASDWNSAKGEYTTVSDRLGNTDNKILDLENITVDNPVEIFAHRGFMSLYPQNTIYAFKKCLANPNVYGVEIDMQITSDGVPVIFHDATLDALTNGTGYIKDKTYGELVTLDCGSKFSTDYAGTTIPTLESFLKIGQNFKHVLFEIKDYRTTNDIISYIQLIKKYGYENKCTITTFDYVTLLPIIRSVSKTIKVCCNTSLESGYTYFLPFVKLDSNTLMGLDTSIINQTKVDELRNNNIPLIAWTIDDSVTFENFRQMGISKFITNKEVQ